MQVLILGLGRLGVAIAASLLNQGHVVVGVETNGAARDLIARGVSPFREPRIDELIEAGRVSGRLRVVACMDGEGDAELIFVCVGTSGLADGSLDLSDVKSAARSIGEAIRRRSPTSPPLLVAFNSTMVPGSMRNVVLPAIADAAGEAAGIRYHVVYHPEFMREGSAVADYFSPARIVIGEQQSGASRALLDLYSAIDAPKFITSFEEAELLKFADNSFHALKVSFANEIGRLALSLGISPKEISRLFLADAKLNVSSSYLRPGGPFGGPCLPKDVLALASLMRDTGIEAPVIGHIIESNASHVDFLVAEIERRISAGSRILLVGLSFKSGTDDLRGSPLVKLADCLLARGHNLAIYDPDLGRDEAGETPLQTQLSQKLLAILQPELPALVMQDLVVLGKRCPEVELMAGSVDIFDIDRL